MNMTDEVEKLKGKGQNIKGHIREEIGKVTNNKSEQFKGKIEQAEGDAQERRAKRKA